MKKAIICDLDGCLLDTSRIHREIEEKGLEDAEKWQYFETYANDAAKCKFNENLGAVLFSLSEQGYEIIFLTARSEAIKHATRYRLSFNLDFNYKLFMRPLGNFKPAHELKEAFLKDILDSYEVLLAIDDEDENLKMFAKYGLFVMKAI